HGIKWDRAADPCEVLESIARYARLVARMRGVVSVWREQGADDFTFSPPNVEVPYRANSVLYNLARGRALLYGRRRGSIEDLGLIRAVPRERPPHDGPRLRRPLLTKHAPLTPAAAASALNVSRPTAGRVMKTLALLGIARMDGNESNGYRLALGEDWAWLRPD